MINNRLNRIERERGEGTGRNDRRGAIGKLLALLELNLYSLRNITQRFLWLWEDVLSKLGLASLLTFITTENKPPNPLNAFSSSYVNEFMGNVFIKPPSHRPPPLPIHKSPSPSFTGFSQYITVRNTASFGRVVVKQKLMHGQAGDQSQIAHMMVCFSWYASFCSSILTWLKVRLRQLCDFGASRQRKVEFFQFKKQITKLF